MAQSDGPWLVGMTVWFLHLLGSEARDTAHVGRRLRALGWTGLMHWWSNLRLSDAEDRTGRLVEAAVASYRLDSVVRQPRLVSSLEATPLTAPKNIGGPRGPWLALAGEFPWQRTLPAVGRASATRAALVRLAFAFGALESVAAHPWAGIYLDQLLAPPGMAARAPKMVEELFAHGWTQVVSSFMSVAEGWDWRNIEGKMDDPAYGQRVAVIRSTLPVWGSTNLAEMVPRLVPIWPGRPYPTPPPPPLDNEAAPPLDVHILIPTADWRDSDVGVCILYPLDAGPPGWTGALPAPAPIPWQIGDRIRVPRTPFNVHPTVGDNGDHCPFPGGTF